MGVLRSGSIARANPKSPYLEEAVAVHQEVPGFEVAMDDPRRVEILETWRGRGGGVVSGGEEGGVVSGVFFFCCEYYSLAGKEIRTHPLQPVQVCVSVCVWRPNRGESYVNPQSQSQRECGHASQKGRLLPVQHQEVV